DGGWERVEGGGAGLRGGGVEIVTYRVRTTAAGTKPALRPAAERSASPPSESRAPSRRVFWSELGDFDATPVFWGERLEPGNRIAGPAIIQVPDTTIVVHPGQIARLDPYRNVLVDLPPTS